MSVNMTVIRRTVWALGVVAIAALSGAACGGLAGESTVEPAGTGRSPDGGSATPAETGAPDAVQQPRFGDVNYDQLRRMIAIEEDRPFYMVNLIRFREHASYPGGRDADLTGREANDRYAVLPILFEIGAQVVFFAEVERQLLGDDIEWDQVAIVRYPSRAGFLGMIQRPDYKALAVHKDAGVERSIVLVTEPVDWGTPEGFVGIEVGETSLPASGEDPPFSMVHVFDFHDRARYEDGRDTDLTGREALSLYEQNVAPLALARGVRPVLRLKVEGAIVGDGREWDEVRIIAYPSHTTFFDMISDPAYSPGLEHRNAALASTYSMMTRPVVERLPER